MKNDLKMRIKRSFALLLALTVCLGMTPSAVFADDGASSAAVERSSDRDSSSDSSKDSSSDSSKDSSSDSGSSSDKSDSSDKGSSSDKSDSSDKDSAGSGSADSGNAGSSSDRGSSDNSSSDSSSDNSGSDSSSDSSSDNSSSDSSSDNSGSDSSSDNSGSDSSSDNSGSADDGGSDSSDGSSGNTDGSSADSKNADNVDAGSSADPNSSDGNSADAGNADSGDGSDGSLADSDAVDGIDGADAAGNNADADDAGNENGPGSEGSLDPVGDAAANESDALGGNDAAADAGMVTDDGGSEEVVVDGMTFTVLNMADAASGEEADPVEEAEPTALNEDGSFDLTQTERPGATENVEYDKGTSGDKLNIPVSQDKDWSIFYDAEKDVYKITFNIGAKADEKEQIIDLTYALELLGQYAESGKEELEKAINELKKPEMGEIGIDEPVKPEGPVAPEKPGMPEGMGEALQQVYDKLFDDLSGEGNDKNTLKNILEEMEAEGLDTTDAYVQDYAKYLVDKADNAFLIKLFETRGAGGKESMFKYFVQGNSSYSGKGEPTDEQIAQAVANVKRQDDQVKKPEYEVDEESEAYQNYKTAMAKYQAELEAYEASLEYRAYLDEMEDYEAKKAELEAKYAEDKAAYDAAIKELKAEFDRRIGANVLEPGDVKKFELYLTSDSKHTYKYQTGSFTLATPGWGDQIGGTTGFDGQILPDEYVDKADYHVTVRSEPIQAMLEQVGMDQFDRFNGTYPSYFDRKIKEFLSEYEGETLADQLNAYMLAYYNSKDGTNYTTIDELVRNNPSARAELTKTETSGNKWFKLDGENFVVDAHLETVRYDTFYKQLFSFAFGDDADLSKILGEAKFNEETNRWEYENDSWTDNGYQNALYYYMDHQEIWQKTDAYFQALLDGGLSAEQATWTSLMMALNIDGELTGNDWQDTKWPWYSSIKLDRMDIDFNLTKKDGETGETITDSETEFQVYYIDKVKNEDGSETSVNMYCTYDEKTNSYTFVTTPSTIWTKKGELNISYAMMKDIVYYLQEMTAPEGYDRDTNVYIVMSEEDYNQLTDEDKAALGEFNKFLDLAKSANGLTVSTDFINVKIVTPDPDPTPDPTPDPEPTPTPDRDRPTTSSRRDRDRGTTTTTTTIPDEPAPQTTIPDAGVPLATIPNEDVPLAVLLDEDVPLASVPATGDISSLWYALLALSGIGLLGMAVINAKKNKASASN